MLKRYIFVLKVMKCIALFVELECYQKDGDLVRPIIQFFRVASV